MNLFVNIYQTTDGKSTHTVIAPTHVEAATDSAKWTAFWTQGRTDRQSECPTRCVRPLDWRFQSGPRHVIMCRVRLNGWRASFHRYVLFS